MYIFVKRMLRLFIFVGILTTLDVECSKILGIFPTVGSHYILGSKLMIGLANAGHDITMVSPYRLKSEPGNGTFREIILHGFDEMFEKTREKLNLFGISKINRIAATLTITSALTNTINLTMFNAELQQLATSEEAFDAVIIEQFSSDALKVYAHIFNCPLIILSSIGPNSWINPVVGNPQPVSYVPHLFMKGMPEDTSLLKRTNNLFFHVVDYFVTHYIILPFQEKIKHQYYPKTPSINELYSNVSLVLLNSHVSISNAVPVVPNMIEVGGYFIDPPKELPHDLQDFLDNAEHGAIYFSMGSYLKSKNMPEERKKAFLNVFRNLKQRVIWKFEEDMPEKSSNILMKKWLPQQDILAHPNIKLFITHGGLLSTIETVYHGVPILAIPVFGDQPENAARSVEAGYGLRLDYNDPSFSEEKLRELIKEMLANPRYHETVKEKSKLFHDRPMKPLKAAVYWVEYVIRHKGAKHLRVAGVDMPLYKYFMLDVFGVLLLIIALSFHIVKLLFGKMWRRICYSLKCVTKEKIN